MSVITFDELRRVSHERAEAIGDTSLWSLSDWAVEFGGEAGELLDALKKLNRLRAGFDDKRNLTELQCKRAIAKEVGDVVISLQLFCNQLDIDVDVAVRDKFNETSEKLGLPHRLGE